MIRALTLCFLLLIPFAFKGQSWLFSMAKQTYNLDSSINYAQRYMNWAMQRQDTAAYLDGACLMAKKYVMKSSYAKAEKLLEQCQGYSFVAKQPLYECRINIEFGVLYKSLKEYSSALERYQKAWTIAERISAWTELVRTEVQMAEYFRHLSKYSEANQYIKSAFANYEEHALRDTALLISIYNRAAAIDNESNPEISSTIRNSRKALELAIRSGNKPAQATSLNELGFSYKNLKKLDSSEILYKQAEEIWTSVGAFQEAMHAMNNRIMLYAHNDYPQAQIVDMYKSMIDLVTTRNIDYPLNDAYGYLSKYYGRKGDSIISFRYFEKYHQAVIDEIRERNDVQIINMTERYESEKAKKQVLEVEGSLRESQKELEQKKEENTRAYIFLTILGLLIGSVAFLLVRINRANKKLQERNREKDTLIQEIHHRVKNNLQFISSLVNMQMSSSNSDAEIHTLNDASRRIKAMALVHEMLYNQKESEGVSIKQYLEELASSLNDVVNSDRIPIRFKMRLADASFNVSNSIALGMIASELVSNAMKHAFAGIPNPEIEIELEQRLSNAYVFRVSDNGVGLPDNGSGKKSLGMRLIDIFSRQLKGKYAFSNKGGLSYELTFNIK